MKRRAREEKGEWKILGCGLRDSLLLYLGKVVPSLADCDSILFLFSFSYSYSYSIHVLNPYHPSLPPSLSNNSIIKSSFLTPFFRHPIPLTFSHYHHYHSSHSISSHLIIPPSLHPFYANAPKSSINPALSPLCIFFFFIFFFSPTRRGTKGSTISYDRADSKNWRFS